MSLRFITCEFLTKILHVGFGDFSPRYHWSHSALRGCLCALRGCLCVLRGCLCVWRGCFRAFGGCLSAWGGCLGAFARSPSFPRSRRLVRFQFTLCSKEIHQLSSILDGRAPRNAVDVAIVRDRVAAPLKSVCLPPRKELVPVDRRTDNAVEHRNNFTAFGDHLRSDITCKLKGPGVRFGLLLLFIR